ncbi:unnamed protein product [Ostreobium quekettii]|uniref:Uncharacterized protein n=1 Tax=Ostreobium quekettii TaxID=121088 RepID=A0A8S1J556_9CHLO|nr:unnamed protein product [Ostreobium quekettii]
MMGIGRFGDGLSSLRAIGQREQRPLAQAGKLAHGVEAQPISSLRPRSVPVVEERHFGGGYAQSGDRQKGPRQQVPGGPIADLGWHELIVIRDNQKAYPGRLLDCSAATHVWMACPCHQAWMASA